MHAKLSSNLTAYYKAFSLPKPNMNGACDNFKTPLFMQNSES